jgi:CRP/FNR family cyclic AMP-dependent transcriptional regulator
MDNATGCHECINDQCFVRRYCSPTWINIINVSKSTDRYAKGQNVFREGGRVMGLYFIQQGKVKVVSTGYDNKEQITRLAKNGHILGHMGYGREIYPVGAVTLEDSWICFVDNATINDAFLNNPKFVQALMSFYSSELRKIELRFRYLAQMTMKEKVVSALLYLKEMFGQNPEDGSLNVAFSRQELAELCGTNAEQVSRELTILEKEMLIAKDHRKLILLDSNKLDMILADHNIRTVLPEWVS